MKKSLKKVLMVAALLCSAFVLCAPIPAFAGKTINVGGESVEIADPDSSASGTGSGSRSLKDLIPIIATTLATIIGILSVLMVIWSGFMYATAAGDPGKVARAKQILVYAIIGVIISVASGAIALFVSNTIGG